MSLYGLLYSVNIINVDPAKLLKKYFPLHVPRVIIYITKIQGMTNNSNILYFGLRVKILPVNLAYCVSDIPPSVAKYPDNNFYFFILLC